MLVEKLASHKMALGFWDRSEMIGNDFVASRCQQLSLFYKNSCVASMPVLRDTDVDQLMLKASSLGYQWILVQSYGHLTLRPRFFELLFDYIDNNEFFLLGHILDYKESYFELHHQCFLVNLELLRQFHFPPYGTPINDPQSLLVTDRSEENFHDEYTPHWIEGHRSGFRKWRIPRHEGWNLINSSIEHGYKVHNFTHEMRSFKTFLYPTAFTNNFELALKDPYKVEELELNPCQKHFLRGMAYNWDVGKKSIFLFNTEDIGYSHRKVPEDKKLDALFSVASGFKTLKILGDNSFHSSTKVIYFDYCSNALDFRQRMLATWDGRNFVDFLKAHQDIYRYGHYQCIPRADVSRLPGDAAFADIPQENTDYHQHERLWQKTLDEFGGAAEFQWVWKAVQDLDHHYVACDLLADSFPLAPLLCEFIQKEVAWYWSNSFSVETAFTFMNEKKIWEGFENFSFLLRSCNTNLHLYGTTPEGIDLQHLDSWRQEIFL